MNVNLEYYKIFYFVAKYGSVTNAAKELCLSQPAVSQSIKQLEEGLGASLFTRKSKGVALTTEGQLLYEYVKRGYEDIEAGENKLKEMLNLDSGEIRIGASDMTLEFYLLPYLERFHSLYPNIKVIVTNAPTPSTLDHLTAGRIDFGVVSSPFSTKESINIYKGRKIRDIFVAGERFSNLRGKKLSYKSLEEYPIICLEQNTSTRRYIDNFLMENNAHINPEFELATSSIVTQFAVRNLGIGCVVSDFAQNEIEDGKLFELEFDKPMPEREICVITDSKIKLSKAATALMKLIFEEEPA